MASKRKLKRSTEPLGYWLDDEFRDGFPDDLSLTQGQRLRIAGWARALTPDQFSDEQKTLLENPELKQSPALLRAQEQGNGPWQ